MPLIVDFPDKEKNIHVTRMYQTDISVHAHDFFELVYVLGGGAKHVLSDSKTDIAEGDYYIIDYGSSHYYSDCKDFEIINCLFKPEYIDGILKGCKGFDKLITNYLIKFDYSLLSQIPVNNIFHDNDGEIRKHFEKIYTEYLKHDYGYIELIRCHLIEILVLSMRNIKKPDYSDSLHTATKQVMKYAEKNYINSITLSEISKSIHYSLPYLSKIFRRDLGITFGSYLQSLRIDYSCRLLTETNMSVSDIAQASGYNNVKFFGKIFKKRMKMSPLTFRKATKS